VLGVRMTAAGGGGDGGVAAQAEEPEGLLVSKRDA
jgi:hypothetical protein